MYKVSNTSGRLNLRAGPGTIYKRLGAYKKDTEVIVLAKATEKWYEVTAPDGKHGYMSASYLSYVRTEGRNIAKDTVIEAKQLRDQPFRIYRTVPSLDGVTVYARHIFYDLMDNMILSYTP